MNERPVLRTSLPQAPRRGQPVWVLVFLLTGWAAIRLAWPASTVPANEKEQRLVATRSEPAVLPSRPITREANALSRFATWGGRSEGIPLRANSRVRPVQLGMKRDTFATAEAILTLQPPQEAERIGAAPLPVERDVSRPSFEQPSLGQASPGSIRRLTGDAWVFWRAGSQTGLASAVPVLPAYGASQAGAVVRYALAPSSPHEPQAYARVSHALDRSEGDVALGGSLRPFPSVPLTAHAELRYSRLTSRDAVRPAAFVTTGVSDLPVTTGVSMRAYAAAGYVAGPSATGFVDGQAVVERAIPLDRRVNMAIGTGVWGGAQEGASRLDVGPSVAVTVRIADKPVRLSLDYRERVAGDAAPGSGAALTLATGF